ncbi:DUF3600 domain-containing protein [Paenibacillus lemnae]|uniref:DUF3600 domain-containing protein n=1 Tax=Paenibacillus lemnae TaxID=1330551 RepID=A0A848M3I4_PAELE|nr:DUF3600 domain-containing protein [Paenibacillus lemnae]NMO94254.1 DUF3600 domain-containing protein [Paenibacillus lemnae]
MNIESHIRKSFQRYAPSLDVPAELDTKVAKGLRRQRSRGRRVVRKFQRVVFIALLSACAVTATAAAASPEFADRIYGSFEEIKKNVATMTIQQYQKVGMKFAGAQKTLGEDYPVFEKLSKQMVAYKVEYANKHWQVDFSVLPPDTYAALKQLYGDIQPYFDRLNDLPAARDVLTPEEYEIYISAQVQRETIMSKAGVNPSDGPVQLKQLPKELRSEYKKAKSTILGVEERLIQMKDQK